MKLILRSTLRATLLTMIIGLFGCDSSTDTALTSEPLATDTVSRKAAESITVDKPWIRATAPGQTVSGAFMTLVNDSATVYTLSGVGFSGAGTVEIHQTSMTDGVMRMRKVSHIDIPANGSAELKPGSFHIMLIGLEKELKAGTVESLILTFADDSQKTIETPVGTPGE
jgi:copper(I)-binding protein